MIAFFNRNLRLAHLYGGYGPPDKYDMVSQPLPIVDLTEKQAVLLPTVPLHFYRADVARRPCGWKTGQKDVTRGTRYGEAREMANPIDGRGTEERKESMERPLIERGGTSSVQYT